MLEPVLRALPPEAARQIAHAEADEELQQRVEELACKANEGTLTADEQSEYEAYVDAGDIVATLQAVARCSFARRDELDLRPDGAGSHFGVFRVQLDTKASPSQLRGNAASGSAARERVDD